MPKQQRLDHPQQAGISRDEPYAGNNRSLVLESRGSILADKHMETLKGLMKAYEARLKENETIEQRWRRYLDPINEERQLELYRRLMEATQALLDKVSHPKLGKNINTNPRTNKIEPKEVNRHLEQTPR